MRSGSKLPLPLEVGVNPPPSDEVGGGGGGVGVPASCASAKSGLQIATPPATMRATAIEVYFLDIVNTFYN